MRIVIPETKMGGFSLLSLALIFGKSTGSYSTFCSIVWMMDSVLDRWARRSTLAVSLASVELLRKDVCSGYDYVPVILSFATGVTGL